jgi:hypothetical protein
MYLLYLLKSLYLDLSKKGGVEGDYSVCCEAPDNLKKGKGSKGGG